MTIVIIDNYDSFTFNLYQQFSRLSQQRVEVHRNDEISLVDVKKSNISALVISPGPGTPAKTGVAKELVEFFYGQIPLLGVCLGHQLIAELFGAKVIRAPKAIHGKTDQINHKGRGIFENVPDSFNAARYHSLIINAESLSREFEIAAWNSEKIPMAISNHAKRIHGIQFHPESFLTEHGDLLISNFLKAVE